MIEVSASPATRFSKAAFRQGLAVVALLYVLLAAYLWSRAPATLIREEARLPAQTVAIVHATAPPAAPAIAVTPPAATPPATTPPPVTTTMGSPPMAPGKTPPVTALAPITVTPVAAAAIVRPPAPETITTLPPAPVDGLFETAPRGRLPVIRKSDNLTPFKAYRRPFDRSLVKGPIISIAVLDLGLSDSALQASLAALPPDVSFDVSPYAAAADSVVNVMRSKGHEVWLTLPMESEDYPRVDTGADTLLISAPGPQNMQKLAQALASTVGYAGVITSYRPAFMKSAADMRPIVSDIYARGLGFIDGSDSPTPLPQTMALSANAPYAGVDSWLDTAATPDDIARALSALEEKARAHGSAVGVIRPLPVSLQQVQKWLATLPDKGITLVPLSTQTGL